MVFLFSFDSNTASTHCDVSREAYARRREKRGSLCTEENQRANRSNPEHRGEAQSVRRTTITEREEVRKK